jgi:large subunit ribosomal protein L5
MEWCEAMSETTQTRYVSRLKEKYYKEVVPQLMQQFGYKSVMQVPRL